MRYELIRLIVVPKRQADIFATGPDQAAEDRTAFLVRVLGNQFEFIHRGAHMLYRPAKEVDLIIGAVIGRENPKTIREKKRDFAPFRVEDWDFANVLTDARPLEQIVYMQHNRAVGRPFSILRSLCDELNNKFDEQWDIVPHTMPSSDEFMGVAHRYIGQITEIEFVFSVPNILWTISDELNKELTVWRDTANAQEVVSAIRNREGNINPETEQIKEGARAVSNGVAKASIRVRGGRQVYNSELKRQTIDIGDQRIITDFGEEGLIEFLTRVARNGFLTRITQRWLK